MNFSSFMWISNSVELGRYKYIHTYKHTFTLYAKKLLCTVHLISSHEQEGVKSVILEILNVLVYPEGPVLLRQKSSLCMWDLIVGEKKTLLT